MKPRAMYLVVGALLGLLAAGGATSSPAQAPERVIFGADWQILGQHIPFFVALDKGYYKEHGLDVEIQRGYGAADAVKRVAAGTVTFSFGDLGALVLARAEGIKVKMVAVYYGKAPYTVITRQDSGIREPRQLEGKTLGAPAGSATRAVFPAFAKLAGVDASKVKWSTGDSTMLWNLFFAKRVDGLATFIVNKPDIEKRATEAGFAVSSLTYADFGLVMYSNGILAREETIRDNPALVRNFVQASLKGLDAALKNPDEGAAILVKHRKELDVESVKQQLLEVQKLAMTDEARKNGLGFMAPDKVEKTRDVIVDVYEVKAKITAEDLYTNAFLK